MPTQEPRLPLTQRTRHWAAALVGVLCLICLSCKRPAPPAALAAGRPPSSHGIVGNVWYDRKAGRAVYCVEGLRPYKPVPEWAAGEGPSTPERLLGPGIADALRQAPRGSKGRAFSLSLKD